jgi:hypothetical protein
MVNEVNIIDSNRAWYYLSATKEGEQVITQFHHIDGDSYPIKLKVYEVAKDLNDKGYTVRVSCQEFTENEMYVLE